MANKKTSWWKVYSRIIELQNEQYEVHYLGCPKCEFNIEPSIEYPHIFRWNYCPNCGHKLIGENKNDKQRGIKNNE